MYYIDYKTKEKIEFDNISSIKIRKLDIIGYVCDICNNNIEQQFRFKEKFNNEKIICNKCLKKQNNPFSQEYVKNKIKKIKLDRYGSENFTNRDKAKKTMFERYGSYFINRDKAIITNNRKYNSDHPMQNKNIKDKAANTKLSRYGSKVYNNRNKYKETMIERYGGDNVLNSSLKNKIINKKSINAISRFDNIIIPLFNINDFINKENKYEKFKWLCKECGTEFKDYYANGIIPRCPFCFPRILGYSIREKEIVEWLKNYNVIENDRTILDGKELDIYLPDYNLAIEYNGLYWHSIIYKEKWYHQEKVELCYRKGIRLLHIWENEEFEDIKKQIQYYINNVNEYIKVEKPKLYNISENLIWF